MEVNNSVELSLEQQQDILFELLLFATKVCDKYNIDYWLDGGTLMGVVRNKNFIPWDDDIDICLWNKDHKQFLYYLNEEAKNTDYGLYFYNNKINYHCDYFGHKKSLRFLRDKIKLFLALDIFPVVKHGNKITYGFISGLERNNEFYVLEDILPLRKLEFRGHYFKAPNNYSAYLNKLYKDYTKLPPIENQKSIYDKVLLFDNYHNLANFLRTELYKEQNINKLPFLSNNKLRKLILNIIKLISSVKREGLIITFRKVKHYLLRKLIK